MSPFWGCQVEGSLLLIAAANDRPEHVRYLLSKGYNANGVPPHEQDPTLPTQTIFFIQDAKGTSIPDCTPLAAAIFFGAIHSGTLRKPAQELFNDPDKALVVSFIGDAPLDVVVLKLDAPLLHGGYRSLELLNALIVIVVEAPGNVPVPGMDQLSNQAVGTLDVIGNDPWTGKVPIVVIIENNRDPPAIEHFVAVQIGVEQTGFDAINDKPLKILVHHHLKAAPLVGELVIGEKNPEIELVLRQDAFDAVQKAGIGIGVLPLQNEADL